jgi:hypothetical protein
MPQFSIKLLAALAFAGVSVGESYNAVAQPSAAGEVTISDKAEPITEGEPLPTPGDGAASSGTISQGDFGGLAYSDGSAAGAPTGTDPYGLPPGGMVYRDGDWYGYQTPGEYWLRPVRRPIYRVPVAYARYWPTSYYTGGYDPALRYSQPLPMVYQPTDTTQLGFYHQRVPQWQPRPGAIPGPPWPPQWHYVVPVRYGTFVGPNGEAYGTEVGNGYESGVIDSYGSGSSYGTYSASPTVSNPPAVIHPEQTGTSETPVSPTPAIPKEDLPLAPPPK